MEEIDVWVGPVVYKSILLFYILHVFSAPPGGVLGVIWNSSYFFLSMILAAQL